MADVFPYMPAHLRPTLERAIAAIPMPWLLAPKSGEVFESTDICKKRLQTFTLAQGFVVVVSKSDRYRSNFHYIYHGGDTRTFPTSNNRLSSYPHHAAP
jgi:hypothetical protein